MSNLDLESLEKSFNRLSQDSNNADFSQAIEAWIKELNVSRDVRRFIREKAKSSQQNITSSTLTIRKYPLEVRLPVDPIQSMLEPLRTIIYTLVPHRNQSQSGVYSVRAKTKESLISALSLVVSCFLRYSCFDEFASEDEYDRYEESPRSIPSQARNLALVVGASAKDLCEKLQKQQKIKSEDWQELYAKTQDLLLTDKSLNDLLDLQSESTTSEYSVYIILMTLHQTNENRDLIERGFMRGADSLDREDAFAQLPHIAQNVRVSDCLPPTSYQGQGFYQC